MKSSMSCKVVVQPCTPSKRVSEAFLQKKAENLKEKYGTLNSCGERYEILQFLGEGSFAEVVKCLKSGTNENVAVKICKNSKVSARYFKRECEILRRVNENNPDKFNFVRSLDFFVHQDQYCLVFEMLERSLYDHIRDNGRKPLPLDGIQSISEQVLTALLKLKDLMIIHSDIKSQNIMLVDHQARPFKIKIIDFGVAIQLPTQRYSRKLQSLPYRSPEVLLGLPYAEDIDMWSFGCVLAEMLLGRFLYPGQCEFDQIRLICHTQGILPKDMLDCNPVAVDYFGFEKTNSRNIRTMHKWRLKTPEEYKKVPGRPEPKKICNNGLNTLDDIVKIYGCSGLGNRPRTSKEVYTVTQCVDLLKKTLAIRPEDRISPQDALKHSFIGMSEVVTDSLSDKLTYCEKC